MPPPPPALPQAAPPPDEGADDAEAEACEVGLGFGVVAGAAAGCLLLGFLLGTRARQLATSLKMAGHALKALVMLSIPIADKDQDDGEADDGNEEAMEEDLPATTTEIDDFLSYETNTGLDDHPDVYLNPILMYQIKMAKEAQRERQRLAAIEAMEGDGGEGLEYAINNEFAVKQNALAYLISMGARVTSVKQGQGGDFEAVKERRRLLKTVDIYLTKELEVDTKPDAAKGGNSKVNKKVKSAMDVAKDSGVVRYGGDALSRHMNNIRIAKEGRNVLREWKVKDMAAKAKAGIVEEEDEDMSDRDEEEVKASMKHRGHGQLDPTMLAMLQNEFEGDEWLGEEGDGERNDNGVDDLEA